MSWVARVARGSYGRLRSSGGLASRLNPATLNLTAWWRSSFGGSPWVGTASVGSSGSKDLTEATNPPAVGGAVNGLTPADYDGTNDRLNNSTNINSLVSVASGSIVVLFNADAAQADTGPTAYFLRPALFGDAGGAGYCQMVFSSSGVRFGTYNGTDFDSFAVACGTGGWHLAQARWDNTTLQLRVDSGSWSSLSRVMAFPANQTFTQGVNYLGLQPLDGKVAETMASQNRFSDTQFNGIKSYINTRYALVL